MEGLIATVDDETDGFARLQVMVGVDVIIQARLRLDGFFGSDSIRIPPATRVDDVMVEGSTVTIGCSLRLLLLLEYLMLISDYLKGPLLLILMMGL